MKQQSATEANNALYAEAKKDVSHVLYVNDEVRRKDMKQKLVYLPEEYEATGMVWGKTWGGGNCGYTTVKYTAKTMKELESKIIDGIKTGTIDSGMGYEKVLGACMTIKKTSIIKIGSKIYKSKDEQVKPFGDIEDDILDYYLHSVLPMD